MGVTSNEQIRQDLEGAADRLESQGWWQGGSGYGSDGSVCLQRAVEQFISCWSAGDWVADASDRRAAAFKALYEHIPQSERLAYEHARFGREWWTGSIGYQISLWRKHPTVAWWNDRPTTTVEDVKELIRATIKDLI